MMDARPRCASCPVASDAVCLGHTDARFPFFCDQAAGANPIHLKHIVGRSAITAAGLEPPPTAAAPCAGPPADPLAGIPLAGDVVAALAARIGADRLAAWWAKKTGRPCGCAERRAKMNAATRVLIRSAGWGR